MSHPHSHRLTYWSLSQNWLKKHGYDAMILPISDPYLNEYVPDHWGIVSWFSGFTGSAGWIIITQTGLSLWTDGRYQLQARQELDPSWDVVHNAQQSLTEWLVTAFGQQGSLIFNPWYHNVTSYERWIEKAPDFQFIENDFSWLLSHWQYRPEKPASKVILHREPYVGLCVKDKIKWLRQEMLKYGADYYVSCLPEVSNWLTNIRGSDVPYTPLALSYISIDNKENITLWINPSQLEESISQQLLNDTIYCQSLESRGVNGLVICAEKIWEKWHACAHVLLDPQSTPIAIYNGLVKAGMEVIRKADPVIAYKAVKHPVEQEGMRIAHQFDAIALIRAFSRLANYVQEHKTIHESDIDDLLWQERHRVGAISPSFATIAGLDGNGAIIHYRARAGQDARLSASDLGHLLLVDSGGQYRHGTTDVTRVWSFGKAPSLIQKRYATAVLRGHIALARACFPLGTTGHQLDAIARYPLWQMGANYDHGTGHGVGSFLSVHEGPARISAAVNSVRLEEGMVLSNEPGFYQAGEYGIRLENLCMVQPIGSIPGFLQFETLTLVPYERDLIEKDQLNDDEKKWIQSYYQKIIEIIEPHLSEYYERAWLKYHTSWIVN
jgi:Xaa-Pro aminopeptidase